MLLTCILLEDIRSVVLEQTEACTSYMYGIIVWDTASHHAAYVAGWMSAEKFAREGGRSLSLALRRASQQSASTSGAYRQSKKFPNGDTYSGGWRIGLPEGEGRYCWADGSTYEGGWRVSHLLHRGSQA